MWVNGKTSALRSARIERQPLRHAARRGGDGGVGVPRTLRIRGRARRCRRASGRGAGSRGSAPRRAARRDRPAGSALSATRTRMSPWARGDRGGHRLVVEAPPHRRHDEQRVSAWRGDEADLARRGRWAASGSARAPRRLSAATSTSDSIHVGSCQETTSPAGRRGPAALPPPARPRAQYSAKVSVRMSSSTAMSASGVASTRRSISSHSVRPCNMRPARRPAGSGDAVSLEERRSGRAAVSPAAGWASASRPGRPSRSRAPRGEVSGTVTIRRTSPAHGGAPAGASTTGEHGHRRRRSRSR